MRRGLVLVAWCCATLLSACSSTDDSTRGPSLSPHQARRYVPYPATGAVSFKTPDASAYAQRLIDVAADEWTYFGRQLTGKYNRAGYKENDRGYRERVIRYWREGTGRAVTDTVNIGWSGAFIAYVMKLSGTGRDWVYSGSHGGYIRMAIENRKNGNRNAAFAGFRLDEYAPKPGDLVCARLQRNVSYDRYPADFAAHCDVVVAKRPGELHVIGGNLTDSVSMRFIDTDDRGRVVDTTKTGWFVVIQNRK
ncbi:MAG: DUF2272 domain-containing protein [Alphaproteobacteria bacterium]